MTTTRRKSAPDAEETSDAPQICGHMSATFRGFQEHPEQPCECELPLGHGGPHVCRIDHEVYSF